MQDISLTLEEVLNHIYMDHLSASSYTRVTNCQNGRIFLWLKLIGIFGVVSFFWIYAKNI